MPAKTAPTDSAKNFVAPLALSISPILSSPPYHTNTSQAARSVVAVDHAIVPVTSSTPSPSRAMNVTSSRCHPVVIQSRPTPANTASVIHSSRDSAPILRISAAAKARRFRGSDDLRRQHAMHHPWNDGARGKARHDRRHQPARPGHLDVYQLTGEVGAQHVAGLAGEEHRARHRRALIETGDEERTDPARCRARMRIEQLSDAPGHGQQHARGSRRN